MVIEGYASAEIREREVLEIIADLLRRAPREAHASRCRSKLDKVVFISQSRRFIDLQLGERRNGKLD